MNKLNKVLDNIPAEYWHYRTGASDREIFAAHLKIRSKCSQNAYHASVREIGLIAKCGRHAADSGTKRLIERGIIKLVKKYARRTGLGNDYSISSESVSPLIYKYECPQIRPFMDDEYGLFEAPKFGGFGKAGKVVYEVIQHYNGLTKTQIVRLSGSAKQTVYDKIDGMMAVGMLTKLDNKYFINPNADLQDIATQRNTVIANETRQAKFEQERIVFDTKVCVSKLNNPLFGDYLRHYSKSDKQIAKIAAMWRFDENGQVTHSTGKRNRQRKKFIVYEDQLLVDEDPKLKADLRSSFVHPHSHRLRPLVEGLQRVLSAYQRQLPTD